MEAGSLRQTGELTHTVYELQFNTQLSVYGCSPVTM